MIDNFWSPVILSLKVSSVALIVVFIIGILLAKYMNGKKFRGKVVVETILMLPLVLPPTVVGFLLIMVFGLNSPVGQFIESIFNHTVMFTWWAAVIASTRAACSISASTEPKPVLQD